MSQLGTGLKDYCIGLNDSVRNRPLIPNAEYQGTDYSQYFVGYQGGKLIKENK